MCQVKKMVQMRASQMLAEFKKKKKRRAMFAPGCQWCGVSLSVHFLLWIKRIKTQVFHCALFKVRTRKHWVKSKTLHSLKLNLCNFPSMLQYFFCTELDSDCRSVNCSKKFRDVWESCRAQSCVMGGLRRDKRKYAASDRDSNSVFLFLLYLLKKKNRRMTWPETLLFDLVALIFSLCVL